jgi:RHS repeat-associated protein
VLLTYPPPSPGTPTVTPGSVTFTETGAPQAWQVPDGVTSLVVDARGAQGYSAFTSMAGLGGRIIASVPVTPGEVLVVDVGGRYGFNGGAAATYNSEGGGGSDVREGGGGLASRIVVAGGGGGADIGAGTLYGAGGAGGGPTAGPGTDGVCPGSAGGAANTTAGGAGGAGSQTNGSPGSLGLGGNGGPDGSVYGGGGGGGGYFGGGGGGGCSGTPDGGGGGGSSWAEASAGDVQYSSGWNQGDGEVILSWGAPSPSAPPAAPGYVTLSETRNIQTWRVPAGVTSIQVDARGGEGTDFLGGSPGLGGRVVASLAVTATELLAVEVGGQDGYNGGGAGAYNNSGGGGTDVRAGGIGPANRILVAAGGGGAPGAAPGGSGGGLTGGPGQNGNCGGAGGFGGTQTAGGAASGGTAPGMPGGLLVGGSGTAEVGYAWGGGGGGGGYYGGGGGGGGSGANCDWGGGGGGGGSSYVDAAATNVTDAPGFNAGAGSVTIAWPDFQAVGGAVAATFRMANNKASDLICHCAGEPIETSTGNFTEGIDDLTVPGRGIPLDFSHTYNSLMAATNGPLGYGWTDSYNMSLSLGSGSPPVTATVNQENGTQVGFSVSGTAYTAPPWVLATLVHNGDGTWTYTRKATEIFNFNSVGQLTSEKDLNGYTTSLAYNGSGQLTTVTDPAGRTLTIAWTGGHITGVADTASPPRTVSFQYNDGAGDLTDVIDAAGGHTVYTYDASHRLVTMRAPKYYGDTTTVPTPVTTNDYNAAGQVDWQTDPLGNKTSFAYTPYTTTITDPEGNVEVQQYREGILVSDTKGSGTPQAATWIYSYDPATLGLTSVTDPNGNTSSATYDAAGNQLTATDALGRTTSGTYNALREPLTVVDPLGITTTMSYDAAGNLQTTSTPLLDSSGQVIATQGVTYTYGDPSHPGDITAATDPNNNTSSFSYDANGNLAGVTDAMGDETTYGYDAIGRRTSMVSPNGNATGGNPAAHTSTFGYDALVRPTSQVDQLGHQQVNNVYDPNGNLVTATDADGNASGYAYNPDNQLTTTTRADHTTLQSAYDVLGNLVTQTDAAGNATVYAYTDPAWPAKATSVTDPLHRTTTYSYDLAGNLVSKQDPGGNCAGTPKTGCTTYGYDAANEQTSVTYSDGTTPNVSSVVYDADGQRTSMTDGTGTSTWAHDSLHRLTSSINRVGSTVSYGYDLRSDLTSITYPGVTGSVTRGFDAAGRLRTVTDWNSKTTTFNYDADGNLVGQAYPNATTTTDTVDAADRLMAVASSPNSAPSSPFLSFSYARDAANQVAGVTSIGVPADNNSYSYSQLNQLKGVNTSSYGYDSADNLNQLTSGTAQGFDPANEVTATVSGISRVGTASAGDTGKLASLTLALPTATSTGDQILLAVTVPYSTTVTTPTGYTLVTTTTSGTANTSAQVVLFRKTAATADTSVAVTFGSKKGAKALTAVVYRGVNPNTPIDADSSGVTAGGTSVTAAAVTTTMAGDQLVMLEGENNSASAGAWTPPPGMITQVTQTVGTTLAAAIADESLPGAGGTGSRTAGFSTTAQLVGILVALLPAQVSYSYDLRGNRTGLTPAGGSTVTMTYDQANRLTAYGGAATYAYNGDGLRMSKTVSGTTTQQAWDTAEGVPLLLVDGTTDYVYGPGGLPLEQVSSSGTLFYYQDQLGSTRALASVTGTVVAAYTYDAYGNLTGSTVTGTVTNPFGFAGQYTDAESGLIYLRARYYDPATGQFLSVDPLVAITGSPYGYASDNPLNEADPLGLLGVGFLGQGEAEVGVGTLGAGVQATFGAGLFTNGQRKCTSVATFGSVGGFSGTPFPLGPKYPAQAGGAIGAYAGVGAGIFVTNADSPSQLSGPFQTYNLNIGAGPLQFSVQYATNGKIKEFSITPVGLSLGIAGSVLHTTTEILNVFHF